MRRTKADRWERIAQNAWEDMMTCSCLDAATPDIESHIKYSIVKLLRREHQAVVRLIKRAASDYIDSEYQNVCHEIIDRLKARAR